MRLLDLIEQAHMGRVKGVVEVEHPRGGHERMRSRSSART